MEENNKLFVFEKKEVLLIFIFILLIAVTAFTLGVKVGKGLFFNSEGITEEDAKVIDIKSNKEEEIESLVKEVQPISPGKSIDHYNDSLDEELLSTLKEKENEHPEEPEAPVENSFEESLNKVKEVSGTTYSGKWTVQLVSFPNKEEAIEFGNGFVARGYDPIINAVEIPGRGTWYRVSLGAFKKKEEAQKYISDNPLIFGGKEYQIYQIR